MFKGQKKDKKMKKRHTKEWIEEIQSKARDIVFNTPDEKEARELLSKLADAYFLGDLYRTGLYDNAKEQLKPKEQRKLDHHNAKVLIIKIKKLITSSKVKVSIYNDVLGDPSISIGNETFDYTEGKEKLGIDIREGNR